ncbi:MMPL family transporter [Streptomyces sp. NPDC020883]|uniref:MMPL family transporter n=1 Tax=Streptomyces sp. NPDC020883 TaxID=3365099 RepID=UPI0037B191AB
MSLPSAPVRRRPEGTLRRLGEWCARHAVLVLVLWLVGLAGVQVLQRTLGGVYADDFSLPGAPSVQGREVLTAHHPAAGGYAGQVVLHADRPLTAYAGPIDRATAALAKLPAALSAQGPLPPPGSRTASPAPGTAPTGPLSADGRTGYLTVRFRDPPGRLGPDVLPGTDRAVAPLRAAGVQVEFGGALGHLARPGTDDRPGMLFGFAVATAVLLAVFGGVLAAGLPLLTALIGVVCGTGCLGLLAAAFPFAPVSPTLATLLGLGLGIAYAPILITRHRQLLRDGADPATAAGRAAAGGGRAVLVSGAAVLVALLGLSAARVGLLTGLAAAAALTTATAVLGALTLVPALLGLLGRRFDRLRVRGPAAETAPEPAAGARRVLRRAQRVARRPWPFLAGGVLALTVLAGPALSARPAHLDAGADPPSSTARRAFDLMTAAFGPGAPGPLTLVVDRSAVPEADRPALARQARQVLGRIPGTAAVTPLTAAPDGAVLTATAYPARAPRDAATAALVHHLADSVLPRALDGYEARGYVTGATATQVDFLDRVADRLPSVIALVVCLAFLTALAVCRGVLAALQATVLTTLSVAASYGVVVAVFQWGWGGPALGVAGPVPVEGWVPPVLCAIGFGLVTGCDSFLLSRVRANRPRYVDPAEGAAHALADTSRVLTCAALITAGVFAAFLLSDVVVVKMLGLGLAASVLLDAAVVRPLLMPAALALLGRRAWWAPWWLDAAYPEAVRTWLRRLRPAEPVGQPEATDH